MADLTLTLVSETGTHFSSEGSGVTLSFDGGGGIVGKVSLNLTSEAAMELEIGSTYALTKVDAPADEPAPVDPPVEPPATPAPVDPPSTPPPA